MLRRLSMILITGLILFFSNDFAMTHHGHANAQSFKSFDRALNKAFKSKPRRGRYKKRNRRRGLSPEALIGGAVLGGIIGSKLGDGRAVGIVVGVVVGAFIANEIAEGLNVRQKRAISRSTIAALITGDDRDWSDRRSRTRGHVKVLSSEDRTEPVRLKVRKDKVTDVPPLDFIGETYKLTSNTNVRGGPDTDFKKVGYLRRGKKVNVVGKVIDKPWYFISEDGIGSGFVFAKLLKPAGSSIAGEIPEQDGDFLVYDVEVAERTLCRTVEQSLTEKNGTTRTETVTACKTANGWEMQKAS